MTNAESPHLSVQRETIIKQGWRVGSVLAVVTVVWAVVSGSVTNLVLGTVSVMFNLITLILRKRMEGSR